MAVMSLPSGRSVVGVRAQVRDVLAREFWAELVPELTVSSALPLGSIVRRRVSALRAAELVASTRRDGFFVERGVLPESDMERRRRGVEAVRARFGNELFALIYDELWWSLAEVSPLITAVLGEGARAVPLASVTYVPAGAAGATPHRDRSPELLAPDGLPHRITACIALTDASLELADLYDARTLRVPAGSLIGQSPALFHWLGRNSTSAPRVSVAFELERAGLARTLAREPAIDLSAPLAFAERSGFVGALIGMASRSGVQFSREELDVARVMARSVHGSRFERFFVASNDTLRLPRLDPDL